MKSVAGITEKMDYDDDMTDVMEGGDTVAAPTVAVPDTISDKMDRADPMTTLISKKKGQFILSQSVVLKVPRL